MPGWSPAVATHAKPPKVSLPEDEDADIIRDAFMKSYEASQPCQVRIPGMQDFAAAVSVLSSYQSGLQKHSGMLPPNCVRHLCE